MQHKIINWFENHVPEWKNATYLLAVSGGIDSVVMCFLFQKLGLKFEIAHCNFQLRNEESDGDAMFVSALAKSVNVNLNTIKFETKEFAKSNKISTQEAARELRYTWFEKVREENNLDYVVVGTHKSDEVETMLINLIRGAGLRGLHGILPVKNNIIRPLLGGLREDILTFAKENDLEWRDDSSNESDNYMRNKIRHHVVPVLKEIRENVEEQFSKSAVAIRDYQQVLENEIARLKPWLMTFENNYWKIDKSKLLTLNPMYLYLYELLMGFGFSYDTCKDLVTSLENNSQVGAMFYGKTANLVIDRGFLIVRPIDLDNVEAVQINLEDKEIKNPLALQIKKVEADGFELVKDSKIAALDLSKLTFPLTLRLWKEGDKFQPFGMKGMKKISDFLIDLKVPRNLKQDVLVLESNGEIAWVVGYRISEGFRIREETENVYFLELI